MESSARVWIAALRGSQQRLASLVGTLSREQLRGRSYCTEWSIAQVLSHLGSQAEFHRERAAVHIHTTGPDREFLLEVADPVSLTAVVPGHGDQASAGQAARIEMPAEALLRLVYGRLGPDHTPPAQVISGQVSLDLLRRTFPGF